MAKDSSQEANRQPTGEEPDKGLQASHVSEPSPVYAPSSGAGESRPFAPPSAQPSERVSRASGTSTSTARPISGEGAELFSADTLSDVDRASIIGRDLSLGERIPFPQVGKNKSSGSKAKVPSAQEERPARPQAPASAQGKEPPTLEAEQTSQTSPEGSAASLTAGELTAEERKGAETAAKDMNDLGRWQDLDNNHQALLKNGSSPDSGKVKNLIERKSELGDQHNLRHKAKKSWEKLSPQQKSYAQEKLTTAGLSAQKSLGISPAEQAQKSTVRRTGRLASRPAGRTAEGEESTAGLSTSGRSNKKSKLHSAASLGSQWIKQTGESIVNIRDNPGKAALAALKAGKAVLKMMDEQMSRKMLKRLFKRKGPEQSASSEVAKGQGKGKSAGQGKSLPQPSKADIRKLKRQVGTAMQDYQRAFNSEARARLYSRRANQVKREMRELKQGPGLSQAKERRMQQAVSRLEDQSAAIRKRMAQPNFPSSDKAAKALARTRGRFERAFGQNSFQKTLASSTISKAKGRQIARSASKIADRGARLTRAAKLGKAASLGKGAAKGASAMAKGASSMAGGAGTAVGVAKEVGKFAGGEESSLSRGLR